MTEGDGLRASEAVAVELRPPRTKDLPTAKVALIRPPVVLLLKSLSYVGPMPSVGLAYVAAALREVGHEVSVIDAPGAALDSLYDFDSPVGAMRRIGLSTQETVDRIPHDVSVIGISHMFLHEWPVVREIAELARKRFPDATIVVGGENATAYWKWMFEDTDAIDCCALGEGEHTAVELVGRVAAGAGLDGVPALVLNPRRHADQGEPSLPVRIRKLSEVPVPAWDLFPIETYLDYPSTLGVDRGRTIPMIASRGCPYKCSFCSSPQMWTTRYFVRDPKEIVDEIEDYVARYGIQNVDFVDLTAMTKRSWVLQFCDELERRKLDITWQLPVGTRSEGIDAEVLERLHASGCRNITFAPESGSPRMLEVYDKRLDLDHIIEDIATCRDLGIVTHVNTIIGHPEEKWADRWMNLRFLIRAALAGCDTATSIMFHPYPGSRDFIDLVEAGRLVVDEAFLYDGVARGAPAHNSWNPGISSRTLYLFQLGSMGTFALVSALRYPRRIVHFVRSLFGGEESNHYEQGVRIRIRGQMSRRRKAGSSSGSAPGRGPRPWPPTAERRDRRRSSEVLDGSSHPHQ